MKTKDFFSIIVPVYNRRDELKKCLIRLQKQNYPNFEVLVIDDASTIQIKDIIDNLNDNRFLYYRNKKNGGPYNARTVGWESCKGNYVVNIDSDWEAFPWMLERAVYYLSSVPEVAAVSGMHLRNSDAKMLVRVRGGKRLVTPEEAVELRPVPDCVGAVRKFAVEEWLQKSHDYYAFEGHSWLTFSLKYSQLYVDEPWALYHDDMPDRVTLKLRGKSEKRVNDCLLFLKDHDKILRNNLRPDVDRILLRVCIDFLRNRHWDGFKKCLSYMNLRNANPGIGLTKEIIRKFWIRFFKNIFFSKSNQTIWI